MDFRYVQQILTTYAQGGFEDRVLLMHATLCFAAWVGPKLYSDWVGCWVGWLQNWALHS